MRFSRETVWLLLAMHMSAFPAMEAQQKPPAIQSQVHQFSDIHGKITISKKADPHDEHLRDPLFERYAPPGGKHSSLLTAPAGKAKLSERAVVYLESPDLDKGEYPVPPKNPLLDQRDLQFHPQVLTILAGTTVEFPNRDNLFHNVFSYSQTREFDLGRYPKDDSRSIRFDRPGVVRVYCDIHSHMNATILVLQHPYFAPPDDDGRYVLRDVPEGTYHLVLWIDRDVVERRPVEVKPGTSIQMDFVF